MSYRLKRSHWSNSISQRTIPAQKIRRRSSRTSLLPTKVVLNRNPTSPSWLLKIMKIIQSQPKSQRPKSQRPKSQRPKSQPKLRTMILRRNLQPMKLQRSRARQRPQKNDACNVVRHVEENDKNWNSPLRTISTTQSPLVDCLTIECSRLIEANVAKSFVSKFNSITNSSEMTRNSWLLKPSTHMRRRSVMLFMTHCTDLSCQVLNERSAVI